MFISKDDFGQQFEPYFWLVVVDTAVVALEPMACFEDLRGWTEKQEAVFRPLHLLASGRVDLAVQELIA